MKRFLLFEFPEFYPSGGLSDVTAEFDSKEEAMEYVKKRNAGYAFSDSAYIFDCDTRETIWRKE